MGRRKALCALVLTLAIPASAQDAMERDFKRAFEAQNEKALEEACKAIVKVGLPDGAKLILSGLGRPQIEPDIYWILVRAAAAFQNSNALELVAKTVVDHRTQPVARDLVMALHNNFSPACEEAMAAILRGGTEELRVSALDHLMDIGRKSAIAAAVEILPKERSGEVRRRCFRLLSTLTQQDFGESESNWVGWWEANKNKTWEEFTAGKEVGTTTLGNSRQDDYDRLRESKVLIVRAGEGCKCKKNHDLDQGINAMTAQHVWTTESITKDKFEHDPTVTDDWLRQFIAIIAICTHIREHCACPTCKLGAAAGMRLFQ